jgi:CBS domain containing-hemolysin-like protein
MPLPRFFAALLGLTQRDDAAEALRRAEDLDPEEGREAERASLEQLLAGTIDEGLLESGEVAMLRRVLHLAETTAAEVMTPRTQVTAIPAATPTADAAVFVLEHGHSRYPVYEESMDSVVGVLLGRDVWAAQVAGRDATAGELAREALFVPDTKPIDELLGEMQRNQTHMAVVIDEFGGTAGVVTIEDVIEEIVGEIADELDDAPVDFTPGENGEIMLPGGVAIADLNERFELELPDEDYTTIAGFVLGRLGRMASVGDTIDIRGGLLRVAAVHKRRVERVTLRLEEPDDAAADAGDAPPS